MNKDLTVGKPENVLWHFCLPLFGSVIFQQLYNIADSLIAGKLIGENALAAVGNSYEITLIFIAFAFGCNMGCSVIVSQYFGAKSIREMKTAVYTTYIFTAVLVIVMTLLGLFLGNDLLILINTPTDILADSKLYLDIYLYGLIFMFFYNVSNGVFSALGDSQTPFIFLAVSSVANILVDYAFVKYLNMGVAGVAWATFLCQGISAILATVFVLFRLCKIKVADYDQQYNSESDSELDATKSNSDIDATKTNSDIGATKSNSDIGATKSNSDIGATKANSDIGATKANSYHERVKIFDFDILKRILSIAIPSTLQQSFISIGNIILQGVINDFGTGVIAGYAAAVKLNNLVITSLTTLGNGISNYTAQNLGAAKFDRIKSGFKAGLKLVWIICIPFAILYFFFGKYFLLFFMEEPTHDALSTGMIFLCILAPFYFLIASKLVADGILRGAGFMKKFMIATFSDLILRVVLAIIFAKLFGSIGIWCAWPVGWSVGTAISVIFYKKSDFETLSDATN